MHLVVCSHGGGWVTRGFREQWLTTHVLQGHDCWEGGSMYDRSPKTSEQRRPSFRRLWGATPPSMLVHTRCAWLRPGQQSIMGVTLQLSAGSGCGRSFGSILQRTLSTGCTALFSKSAKEFGSCLALNVFSFSLRLGMSCVFVPRIWWLILLGWHWIYEQGSRTHDEQTDLQFLYGINYFLDKAKKSVSLK